MGVLAQTGIEFVFHYSPLHYLAFLSRSGLLRTKASLRAEGFADSHLRSKSKSQDVKRGFGGYAHLTLSSNPPILDAKLKAGFPHVRVAVPVSAVDAEAFSLCRFNVAMTRYLRANGKPGSPESATNGRYYGNHQIPIAKSAADKAAMLHEHLASGTMIEVLMHTDLELPANTMIHCFSEADMAIARDVLERTGSVWEVAAARPPSTYPSKQKYQKDVADFLNMAIGDATWKGNGLEYDRV